MPASYAVFDVLALNGESVRSRSYAFRRSLLEDLLGRQLPQELVLMPMSTDPRVAQGWLREHSDAGVEGVVAKRMDQSYRAGGRTWRKLRTRLSAEAVVGGVLGPLSAPHALIVGVIDGRGRLRIAGRTRPLPLSARAELGTVLTETTDEHPWPGTIPANRFGQLGADPVHYTKVSPDVVVELDVDTAFEHQRWRHPVSYQRIRADLRPIDLAPEVDSA
jgi:ATP-dependent DNA ligase